MDKNILEKLHAEQIKILNEFDRICTKYNLTYFLVGGTLLGAVRHKGFIPWDDDLDVSMPREDYEKLIKVCQQDLQNDFYIDYYNNNKSYYKPFAKMKLRGTTFIEKDTQNVASNQEIWVDIFPLDYLKDDKKAQKQKYYIDKIHNIALTKGKVNVRLSKIKKLIVNVFFGVYSNSTLIKIIEKIMKRQNKIFDKKYYVNFGSQYGIKKQTHLIEKYYPIKKIDFEGKKYNVPNDYDYVLKKIYGNNYMELPPIEKRVTHNPVKIVFSDGEEVTFNEKV